MNFSKWHKHIKKCNFKNDYLTLKLNKECDEKKHCFRVMWLCGIDSSGHSPSIACFQWTSTLRVLSSGCSCFKNVARYHGLTSQTCLGILRFNRVLCNILYRSLYRLQSINSWYDLWNIYWYMIKNIYSHLIINSNHFY